jgi:CRP/FNR family transcriptional regulator
MQTLNAPVKKAPLATKSFLSTLEIFKNIPSTQLIELEMKMAPKKYTKGQSIFLEGDPAEYVWFVKEGHVKAVVHGTNGKDSTLCMVGQNNMFGTCCCFSQKEYVCHSIAETDSTVVSLPIQDFMSLMDKNPELSKALVAQLSTRLRQSKDMQSFEQETVEKRILHILVNLVSEFGNTIPLTRREIAEMVGTTVETCIRTFARLEAEGWVVSTRGKITVKSVQTLIDHLEKDKRRGGFLSFCQLVSVCLLPDPSIA